MGNKMLTSNLLPRISSIYCEQHYGITKNHMRYTLLNVFNPLLASDMCKQAKLPTSVILPCYKLVKMRSTKALELASNGVITKDSKTFVVVYHAGTRASCAKQTYVLLSFRAAAPEYELPAYVLIKPYLESDNSL